MNTIQLLKHFALLEKYYSKVGEFYLVRLYVRTYMGNHMVLDVSHGVLQRGGRVQKVQVGKIEAYTFDALEIHVFFSLLLKLIYTNA